MRTLHVFDEECAGCCRLGDRGMLDRIRLKKGAGMSL
jgi:hypothetical protein